MSRSLLLNTTLSLCLATLSVTATAQIHEYWKCDGGNSFVVSNAANESDHLKLRWKNKDFSLQQQESQIGAKRYADETSGMDWIAIPQKAMLFNRKLGQRLADNCQLSKHEKTVVPQKNRQKSASPKRRLVAAHHLNYRRSDRSK